MKCRLLILQRFETIGCWLITVHPSHEIRGLKLSLSESIKVPQPVLMEIQMVSHPGDHFYYYF